MRKIATKIARVNGPLEDELIRDRVVYVTNSERVKERLLREEDLTLDKALKLCRVNEQSSQQMRAMKEERDVNACKKKKTQRQAMTEINYCKAETWRPIMTAENKTTYLAAESVGITSTKTVPCFWEEMLQL